MNKCNRIPAFARRALAAITCIGAVATLAACSSSAEPNYYFLDTSAEPVSEYRSRELVGLQEVVLPTYALNEKLPTLLDHGAVTLDDDNRSTSSTTVAAACWPPSGSATTFPPRSRATQDTCWPSIQALSSLHKPSRRAAKPCSRQTPLHCRPPGQPSASGVRWAKATDSVPLSANSSSPPIGRPRAIWYTVTSCFAASSAM